MSISQDDSDRKPLNIGHNGGPPLDDRYPDQDGFVTIGRSIRNHPIVGFGVNGPYSPAEAWIDLIMECRYKEGRVVNGGRIMTIKPGQLLGAVSWLATRWDWTPKQVRHFLEKLESDGMITKGYPDENSDISANGTNRGNQNGTHKGKQSHYITLCNYEIYQYVEGQKGQIERQSNRQINGKQGANEGQQYKEEHWNTGTKEKEEKIDSSASRPIDDIFAEIKARVAEIPGLNGSTPDFLERIIGSSNPTETGQVLTEAIKKLSTEVADKPETKTKKPRTAKADFPAGFEEFWDVYPNRVGKPAAIEAFRKLIEGTHPKIPGVVLASEIIEGAKAYRDACRRKGTEQAYIKHPGPWLNDERFRAESSANLGSSSKAPSKSQAERDAEIERGMLFDSGMLPLVNKQLT